MFSRLTFAPLLPMFAPAPPPPLVTTINNSVRCLNESVPGGALNCLKPWDKRRDPQPRLESEEDDPELIIFVPFTQVRSKDDDLRTRGDRLV